MEHALVQILKKLLFDTDERQVKSWFLADGSAGKSTQIIVERMKTVEKELQGEKNVRGKLDDYKSVMTPSTCWAHRQKQKLITGASSS